MHPTTTSTTTTTHMPDDKNKDGAEEPLPVLDARGNWFEDKVTSALRVKSDKWRKLAATPDSMYVTHAPRQTNVNNSEIIKDFLDNPEVATIIFYVNQKEELLPAVRFPATLKKKSVYFVKNNPKSQCSEKIEHEVTMGDLSGNPLEFLAVILDEVYLPLLSNSKNLESWPEVVANDVLRHFHNLNGAVTVISGKSKGKTMLPLPHGSGAKQEPEAEMAILHTLESAVIDWTHQIKEVIKSSSAAPLEEGLHPGPMIEIDFWAAKAANLQNIHQQLTDEKIQKVSKILQGSKSTYYPAFKNIFDEVVFCMPSPLS